MAKRGRKPRLNPDGTRMYPEGWFEQKLSQVNKPCATCKAATGEPCVTTRKNNVKNNIDREYSPVLARIVHESRRE
jgi:hypothetical protein